MGTIPDDAFNGGENLYVAQIVSYWLMPGTFNAKTKEAYTEQGNKVVMKDNIKLLCDLNTENFYWEQVHISDLVDEELDDLVVGGMELNTTLYIGKAYHDGELQITKIFPPTHKYEGLRLWDQKNGTYPEQSFEVLKYRNQHTYEHVCDCRFEHISL
ncbi:hypothetical protein MML48_9g00013385 [Holotrichia oblita]|uniref:Uncharacterized protein n=1 Tax=Holotrichia oblita TaxID=644536 RepID=A0ACB9SG79_HOLOL|nr:hypothetical protein MML48_9g00013385 [Holotrichia oblita]